MDLSGAGVEACGYCRGGGGTSTLPTALQGEVQQGRRQTDGIGLCLERSAFLASPLSPHVTVLLTSLAPRSLPDS